MKKLFMIMTLFASSFLFLGDVKAVELSFDLDFSLINEDFYKIKNAAESFILEDTSFSDDYIIVYEDNRLFVAFLPLNHGSDYHCYFSGSTFYFFTSGSSLNRYYLPNDSLASLGTLSSNYLRPYLKIQILYSNFDIKFRDDTQNVILYKYNDWSTQDYALKSESFNTLYMNYLEYQDFIGSSDSVHEEELEKLSNFYTVVVDKIVYLSEVIVSNYIYLSIIVIFILVFLFKLIFRRFL